MSESKNENAGANDTAVASGRLQNRNRRDCLQRGVLSSLLQQNEDLQKRLSIAQESLKALTSSLAESNAEAELFRRKYSDLQLQMEALGLASANKDRAKLEQRLLAAVSDLQLAQKERDEYRDQMLRLDEAVLCYLKTSQSGDAQGADGRGNSAAQHRQAGDEVYECAGFAGAEFDGRKRDQREG